MRFEIPIACWSWVEDGRPVFRWVGEHSIDTDWPWVPEWRARRAPPRRRRQPARKTKGKRKKR